MLLSLMLVRSTQNSYFVAGGTLFVPPSPAVPSELTTHTGPSVCQWWDLAKSHWVLWVFDVLIINYYLMKVYLQ